PPPAAESSSPDTQLASALGSGAAHAELALTASTFTSPATQPPRQQTLVWVRIGQPDAHPETAAVLFEVIDDKDARIAGTRATVQAAAHDPLDYPARLALPPGRYVLRLAARDADGRLGTIEHPFDARLAASGPPAVGSLLLLDAGGVA